MISTSSSVKHIPALTPIECVKRPMPITATTNSAVPARVHFTHLRMKSRRLLGPKAIIIEPIQKLNWHIEYFARKTIFGRRLRAGRRRHGRGGRHDHKPLLFPLAELPGMSRGRGVVLQRYYDGGLAGARVIKAAGSWVGFTAPGRRPSRWP